MMSSVSVDNVRNNSLAAYLAIIPDESERGKWC
jgi:hypothetical protein